MKLKKGVLFLVVLGVLVGFLVVGAGAEQMVKREGTLDVDMGKKLVVAHRCLSRVQWQAAVDSGAEMVEFDLRRTRDGEIVLYHDEKYSEKKLSDLNFSALEGVEKLESALRFFEGKIKLDVELKEEGYEEEVMRLVLKYFDKKDVIVTSGHMSSLRVVRKFGVKTGYIMFKKKWANLVRTGVGILPEVEDIDFIIAPYQLLSSRFLDKAVSEGKKVFVWTVNDSGKLNEYLGDGRVYGIVSDEYELVLELREK